MTTASAKASSFLRWGMPLACALVAPCAWAQTTPGQIPNPGTYQGSMQLQQQYDQQQQQQRSQQQQQQQQQSDQQWNSTLQQQQSRQNADRAQGQQVLRTWQNRPPLAPGQNPLLGRWDSRGTSVGNGKQARGNDEVAKMLGPEMANMANALIGGMTQGLCDSMLGRGLIEFRPNAVVAIGRDGREQLKYHVQYRGGGSRVAVLPQDAATFTHMIIDFQSPDRAFVNGVGCVMVRARGAGATGDVAALAAQRPVDVAADVVAVKWEAAGSTLKGEADFYVARSTIQRSGDSSRMWEMIDNKAAQAVEGKPFYSMRNLYEYDCRRSRRRMLAASAYAGHLGKGVLVGSEMFTQPSPWEAVVAGQGYADHFLKVACGRI